MRVMKACSAGQVVSAGPVAPVQPAPVLSAALYARFSSRDQADFANRVLSSMRHEFGGHAELTSSVPKPKP